ncbi:hypothetical protein [Streptomyces sp. CBMA152]|nr:hypothetical protein [Streptomyces sp. CBMA152]
MVFSGPRGSLESGAVAVEEPADHLSRRTPRLSRTSSRARPVVEAAR